MSGPLPLFRQDPLLEGPLRFVIKTCKQKKLSSNRSATKRNLYMLLVKEKVKKKKEFLVQSPQSFR